MEVAASGRAVIDFQHGNFVKLADKQPQELETDPPTCMGSQAISGTIRHFR